LEGVYLPELTDELNDNTVLVSELTGRQIKGASTLRQGAVRPRKSHP
jgi:hypothetical protein